VSWNKKLGLVFRRMKRNSERMAARPGTSKEPFRIEFKIWVCL